MRVVLLLVALGLLGLLAQEKPEAPAQAFRTHPEISKRLEALEPAPEVLAQQQRIERLIGPVTKQRVRQVAPAFSARVRALPPTADLHGLAVTELRSAFPAAANLPGEDIEALAFLVLTQAAQDSRTDLQNLVGELQNANRQKQAQRAAQNQKNANAANELSEEESLRLQMTMDRRSKLLETLSNIEKKLAGTQDAVVQNLK